MTTSEATSHYIKNIQREYNSGIAREHSYRPALKELLESFDKNVNAVNEPERLIKESAPDFILQRERAPIAFVEAKDVGVDLDRVERDEQLQRYFKDFRNLILTDYLEFRWYYDGEHHRTVQIGKLEHKKIQPIDSNLAELSGLLSDFINKGIPEVKKARQLAEIMAGMTKRIKKLIIDSLEHNSPGLKEQKEAFEQTLLPHLSDSDFADMYAQTLAYGLFAARVNYKGKIGTFARKGVAEDIPATNPFLQKLFKTVMDDLDERVSWMVDTLIALLAATDTEAILKDFGKGTQQNDPILHFYETFLAAYDPTLRDKRGVYYTPEPVVSYIVRSVDYALREHFKLRDGLADKKALILDPATGTGTFLYSAVQHIYEMFKGQSGAWNDYVRKDLLPRIFGFELLIASYTVAHMKLGILLKETGYKFESNDRLRVYLTNTLEDNLKQPPLLMGRFISEEANAAIQVKKEEPIQVVMGNPPYSGESANKSKDSKGKLTWIGERIQDYYKIDGKPLGERNPKWLQNDYIKFIRFGQWRISETGSGILAFITDNSYLDSPTRRGMRQQLLQAFDDIYILNLHGNSNKREKTPDGGKDENVFDIKQGVAIGIFIKLPPPTLMSL
ncbi:MAG: N-6 DNA methylase [Anaerolineae bacterium]|nr:N-6 DNA methylase [Anaerolineae bacterium]